MQGHSQAEWPIVAPDTIRSRNRLHLDVGKGKVVPVTLNFRSDEDMAWFGQRDVQEKVLDALMTKLPELLAIRLQEGNKDLLKAQTLEHAGTP